MGAIKHAGPDGIEVERGDADLVVRAENGAVFAMDVPTHPLRLETFQEQLRKKELVILEGDEPEPAEPEGPAPVEMPPTSGAGSGKDAWAAYALSQGVDPAEVELATRDELVALFADPEG